MAVLQFHWTVILLVNSNLKIESLKVFKILSFIVFLFPEKFVAFQECSTCIQIEEGSTMPYSDNRCPQCGKDVSHLL